MKISDFLKIRFLNCTYRNIETIIIDLKLIEIFAIIKKEYNHYFCYEIEGKNPKIEKWNEKVYCEFMCFIFNFFPHI